MYRRTSRGESTLSPGAYVSEIGKAHFQIGVLFINKLHSMGKENFPNSMGKDPDRGGPWEKSCAPTKVG